MSTEQWRPIPGWDGYYEVSDHGRVRSVERVVTSKTGVRRVFPSVVRRPGPHGNSGHRGVPLGRNGRAVMRQVHRLVLEAFIGPAPDGMECLHLDGDPTNNRLDNLRWGTRSENLRDAVRHGTHVMASRTHCNHGHEFTPENTVPRAGGGRRCRTCRNAESRRRKAEKRAAA